ncbi:ABC transporter ATP-binding protein [Clavibacter michiganensis subsp. michiganensis]|nr:ABC transporter ATP-binding protein [Clavibacter michiganensis subsp. michiganensis]MWJ09335.1 ABC transporter ATP-binding protein [Clavibacter michiganensis subsp. michiganensis]MWJ19475.1 ABC transporter ATP-binding protein [Clavibacter michiganensis subsp. michiganensis]MWJ23327.1 ABC transporter ATP-binding protein [Clavibacter michiganensis subsp. michiganensis]MWJ39397.1 ABC transporter ATP-binding protein [Clavibacter michiganensis subsp. michiganensis]
MSKAAAARWPTKVVTERVGGSTGNGRPVVRSADTGRFVPAAEARRSPGGTITQRV